ncbi:MAG: holo-ACP synthase [bacterium]
MAIKGIGIDIIEIERIREAIERFDQKFLGKVFTRGEIQYCTRGKRYGFPEFAVRFAAKEAYSKAIGTGILGLGRGNQGIKLTEVEIVNNSLGKPHLAIEGKIMENVHVSLSHSRDYAVASVYVEE